MPLTDAKIRALKPVEAIKKLSDSGGLQLWMMPSSSRLCNMAYRFLQGAVPSFSVSGHATSA